jgi:hypothetical protein
MFDPRYHDADALIESLAPGLLDYRELNGVAAQIQRSVQASDALQKYALDLWRATAAPADYGVKVSDLDTAQLMLAGARPARHEHAAARRAGRRVAGRAQLRDARRTCSRCSK